VKRKQPESLRQTLLRLLNLLTVCSIVLVVAGILFTIMSGEKTYQITRQAVILIGCGVVLTILILYLIIRRVFTVRIFTPLDALRDGVYRLGQGDLGHRIPVTRMDEIGITGESLNQMAEALHERETVLNLERDQAVEASLLKSRLLVNVNHDLRTPLSAILGYVEMFKGGELGEISEEQLGISRRISASVRRLMSLVNSLLDQAQIENETLTLNHEAFSVRDLVAEIVSNMTILAEEKSIAIKSDVALDVPGMIVADGQRIHQILMNLMGNAVKFTRKGEVRVRVFLPEPEHWAIEVSDTGPGIPAEEQEMVFEPFRHRNGIPARKESGTGLGLSIVRGLVQLMGGGVYLQSTEGVGSTFTVVLPLHTEENPPQ